MNSKSRSFLRGIFRAALRSDFRLRRGLKDHLISILKTLFNIVRKETIPFIRF